jgi:hypothetical protein
MKIILTPDVFARLEAARAAVGRHELSGFGFVKVVTQDGETIFEVYDAVLLDVGSSAFTEIPSERILPLLDRFDAHHMKLWWHAHPLGNNQPGAHNWSSTDNHTATTMPLGGVPELVKWSISMVRTPQTWVGRFDRYQDGKVSTSHIPVIFCRDQAFIDQAISYKAVYEARLDQMQKELAVLARPFGRQQLRVIKWVSTIRKKSPDRKKRKSHPGMKNKK